VYLLETSPIKQEPIIDVSLIESKTNKVNSKNSSSLNNDLRLNLGKQYMSLPKYNNNRIAKNNKSKVRSKSNKPTHNDMKLNTKPKTYVNDHNISTNDTMDQHSSKEQISDELKALKVKLDFNTNKNNNSPDSDILLQRINELRLENKYTDCCPLIDQLISANPANPEYIHLKAKNQMDLKEYDSAIFQLLSIKNYSPNSTLHLLDLAISYYLKKDFVRSEEVVSTIVRNDKNNEDALYLRYKIWKHMDKFPFASAQLNNLMKIDDSNLSYMFEKSRLYFSVKAYKDALNILDDIIKLSPNDPNYYLLKFKCLFKLGRYTIARDLLDHIFSKFPAFEKGIIEYEYYMKCLKEKASYEVDDLSECHEFIPLSSGNKDSKNNNLSRKRKKKRQ
jgi:tetratricopeptide (TPR) repeat protein